MRGCACWIRIASATSIHFLHEEQGYRELADQAEKLLDDPERAGEIDDLLDRHGTGRVLFRNTRHVVKGFPQREVHPVALPADGRGDPYRDWLGELLRELRDARCW